MLTPIGPTLSTALQASLKLTDDERHVYAFLLGQIGTSRVPVCVPLYIFHRKFYDVSIRTIQRRIKRLKDLGIIEIFTAYRKTKENKIVKISYYRIKVLPDQAPLLS